jgi:hypothetical protein
MKYSSSDEGCFASSSSPISEERPMHSWINLDKYQKTREAKAEQLLLLLVMAARRNNYSII